MIGQVAMMGCGMMAVVTFMGEGPLIRLLSGKEFDIQGA